MTDDARNYRRTTVGYVNHPRAYGQYGRPVGIFTSTAAEIAALPECLDAVDLAVWGVQVRDAIRALPTFGGARCS